MNRDHAKEIVSTLNDEQARGFLTCLMVDEFIDSFKQNGVDFPFIVSLSSSFVSQILDHTTDFEELENMDVNIDFDKTRFILNAIFKDAIVQIIRPITSEDLTI